MKGRKMINGDVKENTLRRRTDFASHPLHIYCYPLQWSPEILAQKGRSNPQRQYFRWHNITEQWVHFSPSKWIWKLFIHFVFFSDGELEPCPVSNLLQFHDRYLAYLIEARDRETYQDFGDQTLTFEDRKAIIEVNMLYFWSLSLIAKLSQPFPPDSMNSL